MNERTTRTRVIAGHLRKRALKIKGIDKAEAVIVDFDVDKGKAATIAFNKISASICQR